MADYPTILNLPAPRLRGYSRESAVAEKFQAMVKLGVLNSRVKDFFDIWLLSRQFDFDGGTMALAMRETFVTRGTTIPGKPVAFTDDFANAASRQTQWQGFVRKNRLQNAPASFADSVEATADFLGPITRALAAGAGFQGLWKAPGPWRQSSGNR